MRGHFPTSEVAGGLQGRQADGGRGEAEGRRGGGQGRGGRAGGEEGRGETTKS